MKKLFIVAIIMISTLSSGQLATAHSGGLNSSGCHAGSQPYHCHRSPSEMVGNRLRCDLGSRSIECSGWKSSYTNTLEIQRQLVKHCSYLPYDFIDGTYGWGTKQALIEFQYAYGLTADGVYGPATAKALSSRVTGACRK